MSANYSNMSKFELINLIKEFKNENNTKYTPSGKERFIIHEKDLLIAKQKEGLRRDKNELKEIRDIFEDFYDFAPIGYASLNDTGIIKNLNLNAAELLGIEKNSTANLPFIRFLASADIKKFMRLLDYCKHNYEQSSNEFEIRRKDAKNVFVHLTAAAFHDYKAKAISFRIFFIDITERKQHEKIIAESEQRFRLMADNSPVMIWMTDANNQLEYMNRTKFDFFGKKPGELTHKAWLQTRHPQDREKFKKKLSNSAKQKKGFSIEIRVKNKEGNYRWLLDSAAPRLLEDGTFLGFIGSGIDITETINSRIETERSLKEKELLMKEIHHRVKNNLQVIVSLLNLQSSYVKDKASLSMFKSSQDRVRSMAMVHEKLYRSINIMEVDLKDYINDLSKSLFTTYSTSPGITLKLDIADIHLDVSTSISVGLIINELVSNALKHAFKKQDKGEISIELTYDKKDGQINLLVKDNGSGIRKNNNSGERQSFGFELVDTLISQHNGTLEINGNGKTEIKICLEYKNNEL